MGLSSLFPSGLASAAPPPPLAVLDDIRVSALCERGAHCSLRGCGTRLKTTRSGPSPTSDLPASDRRFHYQKTPGLVVTSKGYVAFVSDECYLVVLANPDAATAASFWDSPIYVDNSAVSVTAHSDCGDLVLDEADRAYTVSCDYNSLECFVFGWDLSNPLRAKQLAWSPSTVTGRAFPRVCECGRAAGPTLASPPTAPPPRQWKSTPPGCSTPRARSSGPSATR